MIELIKRYLVCFGPKRCGPNILINQIISEEESLFSRFDKLKQKFYFEEEKKEVPEESSKEASEDAQTNEEEKVDASDTSKPHAKLNHYQRKRLNKMRKLDAVKKWFKINEKEIQGAITAGFEYATNNGPMFGEAILGACYVIDEVEVVDPAARDFLTAHKTQFEDEFLGIQKPLETTPEPEEDSKEETKSAVDDSSNKEQQKSVGSYSDTYGPIPGQLMSSVSKLCRKGFLNAEPRVVEGIYKCEVQVSSENLGKIYSVIGKNRAKTLAEELQENSEMFLLKILVPVYESFNFSNEIRDRECGIPHPQLIFYGWEVNPMDPFHVSMTDDEIEEYGDQELPPNQIKIIIDQIRRRRGLAIEKKLVEDGSKQVTLSRKK